MLQRVTRQAEDRNGQTGPEAADIQPAAIPIGSNREALQALVDAGGDGVLAILSHTVGSSYRAVGSLMAFPARDGQIKARVGSLSSGCIDEDLAIHAQSVLNKEQISNVRYGAGSPYRDIKLPCGGGITVLLVPQPDTKVLGLMLMRLDARQTVSLHVDQESGKISLEAAAQTGGTMLTLTYAPDVRVLIFGQGEEATCLADLVSALHHPCTLYTPDERTLKAGESTTWQALPLPRLALPDEVVIDPSCAIVLLLHQHDGAPALLRDALQTKAFYIGALGSQTARDTRDEALRALGVPDEAVNRIHGPVGLIPSARNPQTLALSVLAEIMAVANGPAP